MGKFCIGNPNLGKYQPKKTYRLSMAKLIFNPDLERKIMNWFNHSNGFFIFIGKPGCGKTTLAIALGNYYLEMKKELQLQEFGLFKEEVAHYPHATFLPMWAFYNELKESYEKGGVWTEKEVKDKYLDADFLILDDLGSGMKSDWEVKCAFEVVDHRWSNGLKTLISSNLDLDEIKKVYGERFHSRLTDSKNLIHQDWQNDFRSGRKHA